MDVTTFVLYASMRLEPKEIKSNLSSEHMGSIVAQNANMAIANQNCSIEVSEIAFGYQAKLVNVTNAEIAFFVDVSSNKYDNKKPRRVRMKYTESWYQDWISQTQPNFWVTSAKWNLVHFRNEVNFDSLRADVVVSSSTTEKILLWPGRDSLSTPWIQTSTVAVVPANSSGVFTYEFFEAEDVNMDGKIDSQDLSIVLNSWDTPKGDVNGDGKTNAEDSGMVLGKWRTISNDATRSSNQ